MSQHNDIPFSYIIQAYPNQSNALLEYEDTPCGVFDPEVPDPELGGAQSTFLWELSTLTVKNHTLLKSFKLLSQRTVYCIVVSHYIFRNISILTLPVMLTT